MATPKKNKVASNPNPSVGAQAPPEVQVTPRLASDPVPGPAVGSGDPGLSALQAVIVAVLAGVTGLDARLRPYYRLLDPTARKHTGRISQAREALIPAIVDLGRTFPVVVPPNANPDAVDATLGIVRDLRNLRGALGTVVQNVDDTLRSYVGDASTESRDIYVHAGSVARRDATVATRLQPIRTAMRSGPRVTSAQRTADAAQRSAAAAQHRAATAQQSADAAKLAETLAAQQRQARHAAKAPPAPLTAPTPPNPPTSK